TPLPLHPPVEATIEESDSLQSVEGEAASPTNLGECRRSSRKKIIKFDVRDLLNKNRKQHKIQIEARIDSNAPIPGGPSPLPDHPAVAAAGLDNRRVLVDMPTKDIFAKPKATSALIAAQVSSEPTTGDVANVLSPVLRKRGRPRKVQPPATTLATQIAPAIDASAISSAIFNYSDSDTNSTSGTISTASCSSGSSGDNDTGSDIPKKGKSKLRVSLKRLNMPKRRESMDSGGISVVDVLSSSSEDTMPTPPLETLPPPDFILSSSPAQPVLTPVLTEGNVQESDEDSDSQIIFVEIETETKPEMSNDSNDQHDGQNQENTAERLGTELSDRKFKILFPKTQQQEQQQEEADEPESQELIVEVLCEPPSLWSSADDEADEDGDVTPRRSKRSIPRSGGHQSNGKTLEETFAEITAECSKQVANSNNQGAKEKQQSRQEKELETVVEEAEADEDLDGPHTLMEVIDEVESLPESMPQPPAICEEIVIEPFTTEPQLSTEEITDVDAATIPNDQIDRTLPTVSIETDKPTDLPSVDPIPEVVADPTETKLPITNIESNILRIFSTDNLPEESSPIFSACCSEIKAQSSNEAPQKTIINKKELPVEIAKEKTAENESSSPKDSSVDESSRTLALVEETKIEVEKPASPAATVIEKHTVTPPPKSAMMEVEKSPLPPPPSSAVSPVVEEKKIESTSKSSKASSATGMGFIECDAMFKAMDKANAQMRNEEKHKKKLKVAKLGKKQDREELQEQQSSSATASPKSATIRERRNTISSAITAIAEVEGFSPLSKRRFSLHPKASPSPDLSVGHTAAQSKKKQKKKTGKTAGSQSSTTNRSRQISVDSSGSSASPSGTIIVSTTKRKSKKSTEALQAALTETESSESTSSGSRMRNWKGAQTPSTTSSASPELEAPDPLKDIAKFIEDGVNLLKRDYKLDDEEQQQQQQQQQQQPEADEDEFAERVANMETPAATPSPSPQPTSHNSEPEQSGVRRSHRIKQKPQGMRSNQGRTGPSTLAVVPSINMEDQLSELAHIEAINEQFLRNEGLNTFHALKENYYRCARQVSQENAEMQCDCFLTGDEEAQGHLCCGARCINRMLMIECGPLCTNGDRCTNKRFQQHQCWPCRVFRTEKKGCGITAELQIPPGEFIMEYVGEVIDAEEFERRQHLYSKDRNRHYYFMALRGEAIIDATSKGNISRYINHSCDPNAETQKWTVNGELRIGFFSVKTILPGEEITFDYQYQRYGRDAQRCYCEAINCRGWIGGEPDSDEGEQLDEQSDASDAEDDEEQQETQEEPKTASALKATAIKGKNKAKTGKLALTKGQKTKSKDQPKAKDKEYKAGRWLRPSTGGGSGASIGLAAASGTAAGAAAGKSSRKPKVNKFHAMLEDPDVLEELTLLSRSGLKNQLDTLRFSRCMVRAKLITTRLQLLGVLTRGEMPCRRLFLDYHGLRLLHAWISESGNDDQLRLALLDALEVLPIPNRTMLNDSRVYQSVQLWATNLEQHQQQHPEPDQEQNQEEKTALRERIMALLKKWNALPEIFRIPKRERIEQMKEHEREADRHSTALEDRSSNTDRFRQDRFRRDTLSARKPSSRMSGNNTICTITSSSNGNGGNGGGGSGGNGNSSGSTSETTPLTRGGGSGGGGGGNGSGNGNGNGSNDPRRRCTDQPQEAYHHQSKRFMSNISKEARRLLFERRVAMDEAEKRVSSEDWREHETRCEYFGFDLNTATKMLPFYQNTETGEWFNSKDMKVPAPPRALELLVDQNVVDIPAPERADVEYKLPPSVDPLPPAWHWRLTPDNGDIYYYNLRDRISQWEPPSAEQRLQPLVPEELPPSSAAPAIPLQDLVDPEILASELINIDVDYVGGLSVKSLSQYVEAKIRERRELRRSRLESICLISPRRDEDRLYNQMESRKYKENKEKIRRRKELYRRRRLELLQQQPDGETNADSMTTNTSTAGTSTATSVGESLPIQGYLYSSDEDAPVEDVELPLIDGIVAGQTQVDELDAINVEPSTSKSALAALIKSESMEQTVEPLSSSKRKLPMPPTLVEQKKHRLERSSKKSSKGFVSSSSSGREATEKFRFAISGHVADFLRPYRKDNCQFGRITCDEDYRFLIKRLSHHITTKEMRYCDLTGNPLACTESVKHKSYDFVNQYMRKKGCVYKKPADEPCF
ncbi:LOW QUALITY PROTEIN: histone-lysine N-methyltransferase Set2, partial [Drosophila tropicalis]|uniref:LOW QUALITY PROTEIN: histone-lysine N-methyltransferase Set2 n=1 Tax=Drosophila tropicalis TaxID=46794 RepID=UPI0035ABF24B